MKACDLKPFCFATNRKEETRGIHPGGVCSRSRGPHSGLAQGVEEEDCRLRSRKRLQPSTSQSLPLSSFYTHNDLFSLSSPIPPNTRTLTKRTPSTLRLSPLLPLHAKHRFCLEPLSLNDQQNRIKRPSVMSHEREISSGEWLRYTSRAKF